MWVVRATNQIFLKRCYIWYNLFKVRLKLNKQHVNVAANVTWVVFQK